MPMATARPALSLKGRALRLLSQREHSRPELERKLASPEVDADELARALDELQAKGFISEARVVESVVHRRAAKLGTARVQQELQAKGLSPDAIGEALAQLRGTEVERAREVWRKKFGTVAADAAERATHMRCLASRGFSPDAIRRVVSGGEDD